MCNNRPLSELYAFALLFINDTATTEIYTLSLHDALPIFLHRAVLRDRVAHPRSGAVVAEVQADRKSTRLNSSHANISYAVFCLKKTPRNRRRITCTTLARRRAVKVVE